MSDFEMPPGDPGTIKTAAEQLGTLGGHAKGQEAILEKGFSAALQKWKGPRAETFRDASAGIQAQVKTSDSALTNVAALLKAYGVALHNAREDITHYSQQAAQRQSAGQSTDSLATEAQTTRSNLKKLAASTAAAIDALTDTALPGASTLDPDQIARRVDSAYETVGIDGAINGGTLTAAAAWKALSPPSKALDPDEVKSDGEVDWAQVARDSNDKLVNAWAVGTAPKSGWMLGQLARNFTEYTKALNDLPKSYADFSGPGLDTPTTPAEDIDTVLDNVLKTVHLSDEDMTAFAKDFDLAQAVKGAGEGGLTGFMAGAGHVLCVLGVAGDVWTIFDPGVENPTEAHSLQIAAGANIAGIGAVEFGGALAAAAGLDAAVGWVPVAGQVVVVATGLFLAGDWAYHHWHEIEDWGGDAWRFATSTAPRAVGDAWKATTGALGKVGGWLGL